MENEKTAFHVRVRQWTLPIVNGEVHTTQDNSWWAKVPNREDLVSFSGHKVCVSIGIEEENYLKSSELSGDDIRGRCEARILFNGNLVHVLNVRDWLNACLRIPHVVQQLLEHPVAPWEDRFPEQILGRKVFFRDQPAVVDSFTLDACVMLVPESKDAKFKRAAYDEGPDESPVKCDLLDQSIWWWRG